MSTIYRTSDGTRIIVRNEGPPGKGVPDGGSPGQVLIKQSFNSFDAEWADPIAATSGVSGPATSTNNAVTLWNGTTGNLVKDSGVLLSSLFTATQANNKVDKIDGRGLSEANFTTAEKTKLNSLGTNNFRGSYATLAALQAAITVGNQGDYAYVEAVGSPTVNYVWDSANNVWSLGTVSQETGATIATKLFAEPDTNNFTNFYKGLADTAVQTTTFDAVVLDFQNQIDAIDPSTNPTALRADLGLATTDAVTFGSVQTAAVNGATAAMQWGQITPITLVGMTTLGFTHQQAASIGGTLYFIPMKAGTAFP